MSSYFDNYAPWKNIKTETIDGQIMVKIPKFYVKYGTVNGRPTWWVSDVAVTDFEVHPAFLRQGKEMDCFYIGAYTSTQASPANSAAGNSAVRMSWQNQVNNCSARGADWHCVNIYEHMAIALLMTIEMGSPDMQTLLGNGTEVSYGANSNHSSKSNWRGMYSLYGHNAQVVTGIYVNAGKLQVWDANGYGNKVTTSVTIPNFDNTFCEGFQTDKGGTLGTNTEYDLNYLFLPKAAASEATSATGDAVWSTSGDRVCHIGGHSGCGSGCGMFCLLFVWNASGGGYEGYDVRIAKYGPYSA